MLFCIVFFFKQKTAYEIVSRDWSSDVCSSDLSRVGRIFSNKLPVDSDRKICSTVCHAMVIIGLMLEFSFDWICTYKYSNFLLGVTFSLQLNSF